MAEDSFIGNDIDQSEVDALNDEGYLEDDDLIGIREAEEENSLIAKIEDQISHSQIYSNI